MLDDLKNIHELDAQDALGIIAKQAEQLRMDLPVRGTIAFGQIDTIVYAGMGGSALAGQLVHTWPTLPKPFELVRDYTLPSYVNGNTLVVVSSYSGNTEETVSALEDAAKKGAQIAVIASGGKLQEIATQKNYPFIQVPKVDQPRYAMFANFKALLIILQQAGVLQGDQLFAELTTAANFVDKASEAWLPTVPTANNPAKQLAQELLGKSVVVYGGPHQFAAAYKWKISINENAKQVAWAGQLPEFDHNELPGWSEQPRDKPYAVIDLRSDLEHPRVQRRFEVGARMLSGKRPEPIVVQAEGETVLEHLLWTIAYGDFVSVYLGLLNGLNPAPVVLIEAFKKELG
ncbi:MAG TPA: bifunctional phosphoglucose/phosphomannose isomerase [Candidatus Saccharimonadales bacterium]|nr:bifunctional phosphoglucose/phosphomannose isomerase [Candidatus Saccharimonadales bacterium]